MNFHLPRLPYREDKLFGWLFATVLLVPLVFSLFTYENFETVKYALLLVFTGAGLLAVFIKSRQPRVLRAGKYFYWFLGLFWLWVLLSSLFAWDKNYSFFGFYARFTNSFLFYSAWVALIFLLNLLDWEQLIFLLKTLVLASGLVALWGLLQSVGLGFYLGLTTDFFNRAAPSFLGNTDFSSMFVVALLPLTILFWLRSRGLGRKIYYGLSVFIQLLSLFVFASRGALVALFLAFFTAVFLMLKFGKRKSLVWLAVLVLAVAAGGILGIGFLNFSRPQAFQSVFSLNDANTQNRLAVWKLSVSSIGRWPLFGVGLGNFQLMFEKTRSSALITGGFFDDAHNLPLELAVTGGVFLALWFLCLIGSAVVAAWLRLAQDARPEDIALLSCLAAWLAASLFTPVAIPCYLLLAVLLSACFKTGIGPVAFKPSILAFAAALGVVFAAWGILFLSAEILFFQGTQAYNNENYLAAYKLTATAVRLNPFNRLYYVFLSGDAIQSNQPMATIGELLAKTQSINSSRSYGYVELASLNYLLLYHTKNPMYINTILGDIHKSIDLDPYSAGNYFTLSSYELGLGDLSAAQAAVKNGLALAPDYGEGEIFLAKTYQLQNNKAAMLDALTKASLADPGNLQLLKLWHALQQAQNILDVPFNINLGLGQLN